VLSEISTIKRIWSAEGVSDARVTEAG